MSIDTNPVHIFESIQPLLPINQKNRDRYHHLPDSSFRLVTQIDTDFQSLSKHTVAVCFSGGPAPGGHNVVASIVNHCKSKHQVLGVHGGPSGFLKERIYPLTDHDCKPYINTGGFDLLKTDRTKLISKKDLEQLKQVIQKYRIDGIIMIGGDGTQSNSLYLANALHPIGCSVIGVPKSIDGDLRYPPYLPISFGFHSTCDRYAERVESLIRDSRSIQKYWHIVKLMGRHASHITHQVSKQASPDLVILGEEIARDNRQMMDVVAMIGDHIINAVKVKKDYGVICIPEGLFEWIPDIKELMDTLNGHLKERHYTLQKIVRVLSDSQARLFQALPEYIQHQFLLDRDPQGQINLSKLKTEYCLMDMVKSYIAKNYPRYLFRAITHFCGYEGRCYNPNAFDQAYCNRLGKIALQLVLNGHTGLLAACEGIEPQHHDYGLPIAALLDDMKEGMPYPLIKQSVVTF